MRSCSRSNERNGGKFNIYSKYFTVHNFYFSKPLTFVNEKSQKKEAVAVFKLVQIYMSDRKAKVGTRSVNSNNILIFDMISRSG